MCPFCLLQVHNLSGPFRVEDGKGQPAMPGDLLVVEILDLGPLEGHEWGFTGIFDRENGGGFLTDHFPEACKAIWDFEGIYCSSRHVPGTTPSASDLCSVCQPSVLAVLYLQHRLTTKCFTNH